LAALHQGRDCPLCRRARAARDRAIQLIAALINEAETRQAFERGYGLCLRHAAQAVRLIDDGAASRAITTVTHARLAVLGWELDEQLRRYSWSGRPEGHGAGARAWQPAT